MSDLFDLAASKEARDESLATVADNAGYFIPIALSLIEIMPTGHYTGEDVRRYISEEGGLLPHHPNAWGSLIRIAIKKKMLSETGTYKQMASKRSHARRTQQYYHQK